MGGYKIWYKQELDSDQRDNIGAMDVERKGQWEEVKRFLSYFA